MSRFSSIIVLVLAVCLPASAQRGDKKGEVQAVRVPKEKIPSAPPLAISDALKTFKLPSGFRIEAVASEPLVELPVAFQFDPDGRLWVVEMRGFMPNPDATGEQEPVGRVSVLEDNNGDGRMDKRTTFLDGLVMPRSLSLVRGGVLVAEPPHLCFCRDTNGDLKCDTKEEVFKDYGSQGNPEHTANGLLWARDNWIYSANWEYRIKSTATGWLREPTTGRGQYGITQDDFGRLFFNSNSDQLRADLVAASYALKRAGTNKPVGINVQVAKDQTVWPSRVNPGVNRAYQPKTLRPDGTLEKFTAACSPCIYRGENFPSEFYGNAFVCEPSANLVKRDILMEQGGAITGRSAYNGTEFLTSTDERFRPVNLCTGPDGALYLADMYHGIIQHRVFMTTYLRQQVLDRALHQPQGMGRIYRIVHEGRPVSRIPKLAKASPAELVSYLAHANGSIRDTAQRLLVERADQSVIPSLAAAATTHTNALARLHALWSLDGMNAAGPAVLASVLADSNPKLRAAAIRISEPVIATNPPADLRDKVLALQRDSSADVQLQLALTLSAAPTNDATAKAVLGVLSQGTTPLVRDAARFSLAARQPQATPAVAVRKGPPLAPADQKRVEAGKSVYEATCIACHQAHGLGQEGLAPPLVGSEWVAGTDKRLARIVINGLRGPIKIRGQKWDMDMPSLGVLEDQQIADILTYIRREWGHAYAPVKVETVKEARQEVGNREDAWTAEELLKIK